MSADTRDKEQIRGRAHIMAAYLKSRLHFKGLYQRLASQGSANLVQIDAEASGPDDVLTDQEHRLSTHDEVIKSLESRRSITQPVLDYLKDK